MPGSRSKAALGQWLAGLLALSAGLLGAATPWKGSSLLQQQPLQVSADSVGPAAVTLAALEQGLCQTGKPPVPVVELTIAEAHAALLSGVLTCSGLVLAYLQRITALDQATQLNAVHSIVPGALRRAEALDRQLESLLAADNGNGSSTAAAGAALPPLFCVPLLIKDNYDVAGAATTAGSAALQGNIPASSAFVVERLVAAGAVSLAKTNMGEFALFPTFCVGSGYGTVRNPYHLHRSPAGSSGGSGAGVAASFGMAGLGTDTGNSVRGPSSHAALVGLRPSLGIVSRRGIVPLRADRDTAGPMARTVEDAVRVFEMMVGRDPGDNITSVLPSLPLPSNYSQFLSPSGLVGARVGIFREISDLPGADPRIKALFGNALRDMAGLGAVLVDNFTIRGNSLGEDWTANLPSGPADGNWNVGGVWEDLWACEAPLRVGVDAYLAAASNSSFKSLEAILNAGVYHPLAQEALLTAVDSTFDPADYPTPVLQAAGFVCGCSDWWLDPCRVEFRKRFIESMDSQGVDVVVFPTWNQQPALVGQQAGRSGYSGNNSPMIAPHIGAPAMTVPMGFSKEGLPAGLSFTARPFDEPSIIRAAYAYEQATLHRKPPAIFLECIDPQNGTGASFIQQAGK